MDDKEYVAELLAHIGRLANGHGYPSGLTAAQWMAIRYFARANRYSRTVSAFAEFHATTRGTASQTVKSLVEHGYLSRIISKHDGRSSVINLTHKGQKLRRKDPIGDIEKVIQGLPVTLHVKFVKILEHIINEVASLRQQSGFGKCPNCECLDKEIDVDGGTVSYQCNFMDEALTETELDQICINYQPSHRYGIRAKD